MEHENSSPSHNTTSEQQHNTRKIQLNRTTHTYTGSKKMYPYMSVDEDEDEDDGIQRISESEFRRKSPDHSTTSSKHATASDAQGHGHGHDEGNESSQDEVRIIDREEFMRWTNMGPFTNQESNSGSSEADPFLHKGNNNHQDVDDGYYGDDDVTSGGGGGGDDDDDDVHQNDHPLPHVFRFEEELEVAERSEEEEIIESLLNEFLTCAQEVEENNLESSRKQTYEFISSPERDLYPGMEVDDHDICERFQPEKKENKDTDVHLAHPNNTLGVASRTRSRMRAIKGLSQDCTGTLDSTDDSSTSTDSDSESYSSDVGIRVDESSYSHSDKSQFSGSCNVKHDSQNNISKASGPCSEGGRSAAAHASKRKLPTECQDDRTDGSLHRFKRERDCERKVRAQENADRDDGHGNSGGGGHKKWRDIMDQIGSSKHHDVCKILADSILENNQMPETKQAADDLESHNALPLRFKFEEEQEEEEKSESVLMMQSLFDDLEFCWTLEDVGSFDCPKDELGNTPAEETQYERCKRGKHELTLEDQHGLCCVYCGHVALGPKDVLPGWGMKNSRSGRRRWSESEDLPDFDAISKSSRDNYIDMRNGTVWNIKPGIQESMYEHQQEGFEFLWKNLAGTINLAELKSTNPSGVGGCIISHAPGTGKTRLTIVFIETYLKMFPNCRPAIIAPASMLLTWEEEFRKWKVNFAFHNLNSMDLSGKENSLGLQLLTGGKGRRGDQDTIRMVKLHSWNTESSILGISYSLFEKLTGAKSMNEKRGKKEDNVIIDKKVELLRKILLEKPGLVVLDEGHTPRNQRSNIWNVLQKLETKKRIILSGTPFQNNFAELFNTLHIVRPAVADALAKERPFTEMINSRRMSSRKLGENSCSTSISEDIDRAVEKLKIAMSPFVHVHKGTILQKSLPGLRDCVVLLKPAPLQKAIIERLEGLQITFKSEHVVALTSVHPYLFQHCDSTKEQKVGINMKEVEASKLNPNEGVKTKFIMEFARLSVALNEKVLIFSQYIQPLELIKEQMTEVFNWTEGHEILQLHGKLDQKQRQNLINQFNDPQSESKIMLASTRCCSEGISLVGASRVIILDVVWNPSVERQAICRAYRIGQKKFVHTYHLMTSGTTEADKYCRQAEKERLSELVFSSTNESDAKRQTGFEDRILEVMVAHDKLKEMFEKIINQPKDTDLIHSFGLIA